MDKAKRSKIIKIAVTSILAFLFIWFLLIYPLGHFNSSENKMETAARRYFEINYNKLPKKDEVFTLSLSTLSKQAYIGDLYAPYTKKLCSIDDSWVKVRKEGSSYKYYTYLRCGFLSSAVDHTGPEITLNGDSEITLDKGEAYNEKGVKSVFDKHDKELKIENVDINNKSVDTSKLGTYEVTYKAYDSLDNETVVTRVVKVVQKLSGVVEKDTSKKGYYTGFATNNYIRLSGQLFRIVGTNNDGSVKIVSDENIANVNYDGIQNWLDNYYYSHLTSKTKDLIVDSLYCNDRLSSTDLTTTECSTKGVKQKVAVLSAEDYARTLEGDASYLYTDNITWLYNDKSAKDAWASRKSFVDSNSKYMEFSKNYNFGVRPALTIKKNTLIQGGKGSIDDPYTLGDLEPAKKTTKLNTRYAGEYLNYGGYNFRIIETNSDGTTKVIMDDVLKIGYDKPEISYLSDNPVSIYNPKEKGNIGYIINNETSNYLKTDIFVNHEIEVPIYKTLAKYNKIDSVKKYKVKFSAPSLYDMFSTQSKNMNFGSFFLKDSSKEENRKYVVSNSGIVYYEKQYEHTKANIRVVAHINKDVSIVDGKGTEKAPYKLTK